MSDLQKAYADMAAYGTATVMIVRREEMPSILEHAQQGDEDAAMRLAAVNNVMPQINSGEHNCVICAKQTFPPNLAAIIFVSKKIEAGADALWCLVCDDCDEPDAHKSTDKILLRLNFKRLLHEAGHA